MDHSREDAKLSWAEALEELRVLREENAALKAENERLRDEAEDTRRQGEGFRQNAHELFARAALAYRTKKGA